MSPGLEEHDRKDGSSEALEELPKTCSPASRNIVGRPHLKAAPTLVLSEESRAKTAATKAPAVAGAEEAATTTTTPCNQDYCSSSVHLRSYMHA